MGEFKKKQWDMKVRSITKVDREKGDTKEVTYRMVARDKEGLNEMTIVSASPFPGLSAQDGVIQVTMENSQLTIDDFKDEKEDDENED